MRRFAILLAALTVAAVTSVDARASTASVNFETLSAGAVAGETVTLSDNGVDFTFSGTGLTVQQLPQEFTDAYGFTNFLRANGYVGPITVEFSVDVFDVSFLNPINGTVNDPFSAAIGKPAEIDEIAFEAFDSSGASLLAGTSSAETIAFNATGIRSFIVAAPVSAVSPGFLLGPVTVQSIPGVPVPMALPLLATAISAFGVIGWRRRARG